MAEAETLTIVCPPLDYGPIVAWFEFNRVPDGFAPEKYRRGWLGKMVPVHEAFLDSPALVTVDDINGEPVVIAEPIRVHCMDAIMYLDDKTPSGKAAVEFWQDCFLLAILSFNKNEDNLYQQSTIFEEYPVRYGFRADLSY